MKASAFIFFAASKHLALCRLGGGKAEKLCRLASLEVFMFL
jgi:hypothetical protein